MPNFRSIGPSKKKLQTGGGGGEILSPPAIPIYKMPGLFRDTQWNADRIALRYTEPAARRMTYTAKYCGNCRIMMNSPSVY